MKKILILLELIIFFSLLYNGKEAYDTQNGLALSAIITAMIILASAVYYRNETDGKQASKHIPKKYSLFNVDVFNAWFCDEDSGAVYAHKGIFLRVDKLSKSHIKDYLEKCHGIELSEWDIDEDIELFYQAIRKDWLSKK